MVSDGSLGVDPGQRGEGVHRLDPSPAARDVPQTKRISRASTDPPGSILFRGARPYTTYTLTFLILLLHTYANSGNGSASVQT
jgi:hypothetical protein